MSVYRNDNPVFLKQALDSICERQTKRPDEIVIIVDGPVSDEIWAVLNSFVKQNENIAKCYPQTTNRGLGEALRIGSELCSGDYIFRMDADDISDSKRFEIQSRYLEEHPDVDVLGATIAEFNDSLNEPNLRKRVCFSNHDDIVKMSKKRNPMNHVTTCIKKSSLLNSGGYLPLPYVEDYYLWIRMISKGFKMANTNDVLVYVRVGNGFEKRRGKKEQISSWRVLQKYMLDNGMVTKKEARKNMFYIKAFVNSPVWLKKFYYSVFLRKK